MGFTLWGFTGGLGQLLIGHRGIQAGVQGMERRLVVNQQALIGFLYPAMRGQRYCLMDLRGQVETFGQVALLLQQCLCGDGIAGGCLRVDGLRAEQQAFGRANRAVGIGAQFKP